MCVAQREKERKIEMTKQFYYMEFIICLTLIAERLKHCCTHSKQKHTQNIPQKTN